MILDDCFPQLKLKQFRLVGNRGMVINFTGGLNIVCGRTQAERTMLLRLIRYGLGSNADRVDEKLMDASKNISLTFLANGKEIEIIRSCQQQTGKLIWVENNEKKELTPREMTELLLEKLQMPKVYLSQTRHGKPYNPLLTFNDLSRALFVDRDISYPAILNEVPQSTYKEVTKILMGYTTPEIADAENLLRDLTTKLNQLEQEIAAIKSFLVHLEVPSLQEIQRRRTELQKKLSEINLQEINLRHDVRSSLASSNVENQSSYEKLRSELLDNRSKVDAIKQEIQNINNQIERKSELKVVLDSEVQRVSRHLVSQHVVSTFQFTQCPRCLQPISKEMYERENEGLCMLCGRPLQMHAPSNEEWEKSIRDANQSIKEIDQLLSNYSARQSKLNRESKSLDDRIRWLEQQISQETKEYVSPLLEELKIRISERTEIEKELSQLDYEERQRKYATKLLEEVLPSKQTELEETAIRLNVLRNNLGSTSNRSNLFIKNFRYFMSHVNTVARIEEITWDEDELLPKINGQDYKRAVSGPDLAITVLAYHYSLLGMALEHLSITTNHPKFLIIDEPQQQKMGKETYVQVMMLLANLAGNYKDIAQIVVATSADDVPLELAKDIHEI